MLNAVQRPSNEDVSFPVVAKDDGGDEDDVSKEAQVEAKIAVEKAVPARVVVRDDDDDGDNDDVDEDEEVVPSCTCRD